MASVNLDHQYVEEAKREKSKDEMRQNIGTVHHLQLLLGQHGHVTRNSGIHSVILPPIESSFARTLFQHGVIILCSLSHQSNAIFAGSEQTCRTLSHSFQRFCFAQNAPQCTYVFFQYVLLEMIHYSHSSNVKLERIVIDEQTCEYNE